jgi:hypothetical protein
MALVFAFAFIALLVWYALLPLWMYNRVRGIERALWAIVSQLQAERREHAGGQLPASAPEDREVARRSHHVVNSMFGR